jgi:hypothetical protein
MTQHKSTAKASGLSSKRTEHLKDEVYRQMYKLEASRPEADLALAVALLHAWIASDSEADTPQEREWLTKISSICLAMIETAQKVSDGEQQCTP